MIPQRNISLLANRLYKEHGGRRIPEAVLERDYCLAWFLAGLSQSKLRELLIFKGGTGIEDRILAKEAHLNALWNGRLGHQMEALPQYDEVFRTVRRELRQATFPK